MEFEITIPKKYEKLLAKKADEQGVSVAELLANAIRKFIERNNENGSR